jgi:hypothetical protein
MDRAPAFTRAKPRAGIDRVLRGGRLTGVRWIVHACRHKPQW